MGSGPVPHLLLSWYCANPFFSFAPVSVSIKRKDWPDCWGLFRHSHSMMVWGFGREMGKDGPGCPQVAKLPLTSSRDNEKYAQAGWKGPSSFSTFPRLDGDNTSMNAVDKNKNWAKAITIWRVHYFVFKVTSHSFIVFWKRKASQGVSRSLTYHFSSAVRWFRGWLKETQAAKFSWIKARKCSLTGSIYNLK